jgi:hypothetical protein
MCTVNHTRKGVVTAVTVTYSRVTGDMTYLETRSQTIIEVSHLMQKLVDSIHY